MDRQDRGKGKAFTTKKKKKTPPSYRRPTGIRICEPQPDSVPSRPFSHSRSSHESHPAPTHVGPLDDGIQTHLLPVTIPTPGHRSLGGDYSDVPSTSATRSSHSGSVGLSGICLRDTPETPTTGQSGAPVIQPGTRDNKWRTYIVPEGSGPNDRISKIIFKCISRNFRGCWPYWSKIPALDVGFMFAEFQKYFYWDDEDAGKIFYNFKKRTRSRLNGLFHDARKKKKNPGLCPLKCGKKCCIIGSMMMTLKREARKERRLEHLSRVARYTLLELSARLLCVIEWKKSWVG